LSEEATMVHEPSGATRTRGRGHWPWLLATGPAVVVVASLATAWIAASGSDPIVAEDYYKLGLTINRRLPATAPAASDPGARIAIAAGGEVSVRLTPPAVPPARLRLTARHPGERDSARAIELRASGSGEWVGRLQDVSPGLRILSLESDTWRFPVTVVEHFPAEVRVGPSDPRS
jgi:hypothetical protein